jgi:hypothetical protein
MAAMAMVQAQNAKNIGGKFPTKKVKLSTEKKKRYISTQNDSRRLNVGSKCAYKSSLV